MKYVLYKIRQLLDKTEYKKGQQKNWRALLFLTIRHFCCHHGEMIRESNSPCEKVHKNQK